MGELLNLGQARAKKAETPADWTARELIGSLSEESFPSGIFVAWIDEHGTVQIRRAGIDEGTELRLIRTARNVLISE